MKYLFLLFVAFSLGADAKPCASVPVSPPIAQRYRALGASDGPLGCPAGNETVADRGGRAQMFETGMIVTSPSLGASATLTAYQSGAEIVVEWGPVEGVAFTLFQVHWDLNGQGARQQDVGNPTRTGGRLSIPAAVPGQYRVAVQGCSEARPPAPLRCQGWTSDAVIDVHAAAAQSQAVDPRFARRGMPNRPAEPFSQPPAAQPAAQPDSRYAAPPNPVGAAPGPNGPSIPRPSYSEPGAAPGTTPNTNNPAQGYLGPRNNATQTTPRAQTAPSEPAARPEFARSSAVEESQRLTGSAPAQGTTPAQPPPNPNQKFAVPAARVCAFAPMPTGVYLQEYMRLGGPNGPMGCPIQAPVPIPGANGGHASFQNGSIMTNNDVWPGGVLAAYQDGPNIVADWQVQAGNFTPGFHYDKFVVRWWDATTPAGQVDVPAHVDQPDWNDTHLPSQGHYSIPWGRTADDLIQVTVEGCDDPTDNLLKPDPTNSRCIQGLMPAAPVIYRTPANYGLLPVNDFVFLDFTHVNPPATLEDSLASQRARAATAILQAACSILPFSFYNAPYLPGLLAKMLYADYFFSDNCPGRTINNRDEVYDSLRNQRLWGDENAGSTFEGISLPDALGDIRDLCGPRWQGNFASCPPYRKGEYDVMLVAYAAILSKYGNLLPPDVYSHVLHDLLIKKGPLNPADLHINIVAVTGSETENHSLNILVGQYLTNQLLFAETYDNTYNNATNGLNGFMASFLQNLLNNDFLEYNARPYQDYAITALQYLYSFAADANDAPAGGVSSHAVKLAARMVLDYNAAKVAVSSDDGRRVSPYRRKAKYDQPPPGGGPGALGPGAALPQMGLPLGPLPASQLGIEAAVAVNPNPAMEHDLIGGNGDGQFPRMLYLAGTGIDQLTPVGTPAQGMGTSNYSWQMVDAAFSSYRLPNLILDEMIERTGRNTFASLQHSGAEIYFRSPSFMISAGGKPAPTLYPFAANTATVNALSVAAAGLLGSPFAAPIASAIISEIAIGDSDARGVAVPTTLLPAGQVRDRDTLLQFYGANGQDSVNMCVAPNFACGQNIFVPTSYLRKGCYTTKPGRAPGSQWTFIDFSGTCSTMRPWGFYLAIWTQPQPGSNLVLDGLFEVYEQQGSGSFADRPQPALRGQGDVPVGSNRPSLSEQMHQGEPVVSRLGGARPAAQAAIKENNNAPAPDPALGTLTFAQFVSEVTARNGSKIFTEGANQGGNAYTTLAGTQVSFQIAPSAILGSPAAKLAGNFVYSDAQGRITIHNNRMGEELILDDTNPAAPILTTRTGLPRPLVDQVGKRPE